MLVIFLSPKLIALHKLQFRSRDSPAHLAGRLLHFPLASSAFFTFSLPFILLLSHLPALLSHVVSVRIADTNCSLFCPYWQPFFNVTTHQAITESRHHCSPKPKPPIDGPTLN